MGYRNIDKPLFHAPLVDLACYATAPSQGVENKVERKAVNETQGTWTEDGLQEHRIIALASYEARIEKRSCLLDPGNSIYRL